MTIEKLWGIVNPFRKLAVLLNIIMSAVVTYWCIDYATIAVHIGADPGGTASIIAAIMVPNGIVSGFVSKLYFDIRK